MTTALPEFGPWCDGLWLYRHTDGRAYVCRATVNGGELTWFAAVPQGDWDEAGWVFLDGGTTAAQGEQ